MKIVALICRHDLTILVGSDPRKSYDMAIVENRSDAHEIEWKAESFEFKSSSAIARAVEILYPSRNVPSARDEMPCAASCRDSKNQCADKYFSTAHRSARSRTPVRFILPS
jgi:hypothetical protein